MQIRLIQPAVSLDPSTDLRFRYEVRLDGLLDLPMGDYVGVAEHDAAEELGELMSELAKVRDALQSASDELGIFERDEEPEDGDWERHHEDLNQAVEHTTARVLRAIEDFDRAVR